MPNRIRAAFAVVGLALAAAACGSAGGSTAPDGPVTLHLGYYPNITHASAIVGVEKGIFARNLGPNVTLDAKRFSAGPGAMEALLSGAVDATYVGPSPAINAFVKSNGEAVRIVSGATSGGAFLITKPSITSPSELRGRKIASPQLGNTQDVALRAWLASKGLSTDAQGGGDVSVVPQENAQTLQTFGAGQIDGAWVPEPWASRLVLEGGGRALVDERDLWPGGKYATTLLVVRTDFLKAHPDVVKALVRGQVESTDFLVAHPDESKTAVLDGIEKITGTRLKQNVVDRAWPNLTFTNDPIASSLKESAAAAAALGFLHKADLSRIFDLAILNEVLREAGRPEVATT